MKSLALYLLEQLLKTTPRTDRSQWYTRRHAPLGELKFPQHLPCGCATSHLWLTAVLLSWDCWPVLQAECQTALIHTGFCQD